MTFNSAKAKFSQSARRFHQHTSLSRRLNALVRVIAPRYGNVGQDLVLLVQRSESIASQTSPAVCSELPQLLSQLHQKLYELAPYLEQEKLELVEVMAQLENLHPHLYKCFDRSTVRRSY